MRVAVVHDYLTQLGGAERVVLSLLRMFPDADLYTSVYDPDGTYPEFREFDVRTTWLQSLPHGGNRGRALLPLYPFAFQGLRLRGYDLVISSSSGFAHGVTVEGGFHVVYCYTPPRFLYDRDAYFHPGAPLLARSRHALTPVLAAIKGWDRRAAARADLYVSTSAAVAERVGRVYGRSGPVVHPPVDVNRVQPAGEADVEKPYFLAIARLLPYKRIDLAIEACRRVGARLVVVGEGPAEVELRARAGSDVEFHSRCTEGDVNRLLHGCTALIQPGREDFGLVPLEANAAGRPVVAFAAGGALETVVDGVTGVHVREQTPEAFAAGLHRVMATQWDEARITAHACSFGEDRFHTRFAEVLADFGVPMSTSGALTIETIARIQSSHESEEVHS